MSFHYSFQPELIRQSQKDHESIYHIQQKVIQILEYLHPNILNYRTVHKHQQLIQSLTTFLYYQLTTFQSKRTLGEEYTNLHPFNQDDYDYEGVPLKKKRALIFILLISFSPLLVNKSKTTYQRFIQQIQNKFLQSIIPEFDTITEKLQLFHMAIFFIHSNYFEISRRLADIKLIFTRQPPTHNLNYKNLGRLLLAGLILQFTLFVIKTIRMIKTMNENKEQIKFEEQLESESSITCQLCLDNVKNVSCTPCGHLFCWDCITQYANTKPQCPSCRNYIPPNKIVQLMNYS